MSLLGQDGLGRPAAPIKAFSLMRLTEERLVHGVSFTLSLSLVGVLVSLFVGIVAGWSDYTMGRGMLGRAARLPLRCLMAVAQNAPPILQLYLLFFGLAAFWLSTMAGRRTAS